MTAYTFDQLTAAGEEIRREAIEKAIWFGEASRESPDRPGLKQPDQVAWMKQFRAQIEQDFAAIPDVFALYADMPDPSSFDEAIGKVNSSLKKLSMGQDESTGLEGTPSGVNGDYAKIHAASRALMGWTGVAAENFREGYLDPLTIQIPGQFAMVMALRELLKQEQTIWSEARKNATEIANQGLDALQKLRPGAGKREWTIALTAVAGLATIAAAVPTLGTGGLFVAAGIDAVASVAGAAWPDDPPKHVRFQGATPYAVVDEIFRGFSELSDLAREQERKLALLAAAVVDGLGSHRRSFVPQQPNMTAIQPGSVAGDYFMGKAT